MSSESPPFTPGRLEFGVIGHPFAAGNADVSRTNCPFYERIDWEAERRYALEAEELGFDSIWLPDHLSVGPGGTTLESWTTITSYLNLTKRMRAGPFVLSHNFRYPSVVAKMVSTLDLISGGRLNVGVGAGWDADEYAQFGLPFPRLSTRVEQLREGVQIMKMLWTQEKTTFKGKYYSVENCYCDPKPVQKPHPPLLIGGGGDKVLRLAAEMADEWNWSFFAERYREKLRVLERLCSEVGTDYKRIRKCWSGHVVVAEDKSEVERMSREWYHIIRSYTAIDRWMREIQSFDELKANELIGTPEEIIEKIELYREAGVESFMTWFMDFPSMKGIRLFARDVLPTFK